MAADQNNDKAEAPASAQKPVKRMPHVAGVHFSAPFIKRPVATMLMSVAIILAGGVAYKLLPVASLPQVEYPVISVSAGLPGAD
ncbi:MAG: efflux RND transporter permease subunit, partial [Acidobacteriaceae bacterium]|nr:efflux RND transporter permease subunit [Acidobacteriaceae bacterium]